MSDTKRCTKCGQDKPIELFSPCRNTRQPACKDCRNAIARARPRREPAPSGRCVRCEQILPREAFWRSSQNSNGLQSECKECFRSRKTEVRFEVTVSEKVCKDCGAKKDAADFCLDPKRKGGLRSECRECTNVRTKAGVYKLPRAEVRSLCATKQCEICQRGFSNPRSRHIDHCHATGIVRGVLCRGCNHMLGEAMDRPEILARAIEYLKRTTNGHPAREVVDARSA